MANATATGFTKERMLKIENETVVGGHIVDDHLILTTREGLTIDAGNVRGPAGSGGDGTGTGQQLKEKSFAGAVTPWVFQHNFGTKGVSVACFDSGTDGKEFEGDVSYPDFNTVRIDFYYPQSGLLRVWT